MNTTNSSSKLPHQSSLPSGSATTPQSPPPTSFNYKSSLPSPQQHQQLLQQQLQQQSQQEINLVSNMGKHDIKRGIGHRQQEAGGKFIKNLICTLNYFTL